MNNLYVCPACGQQGQLNNMHYEYVGGLLVCRECNADCELCLLSELKEHDQLATKHTNVNFGIKEMLDKESDF